MILCTIGNLVFNCREVVSFRNMFSILIRLFARDRTLSIPSTVMPNALASDSARKLATYFSVMTTCIFEDNRGCAQANSRYVFRSSKGSSSGAVPSVATCTSSKGFLNDLFLLRRLRALFLQVLYTRPAGLSGIPEIFQVESAE